MINRGPLDFGLNFMAHLRLNANIPITFQGGLKLDETGSHAFLFLRRRGSRSVRGVTSFRVIIGVCCEVLWASVSIPWDLPRNVPVTYDQSMGRIIPNELDVVVLVKRNAADSELSQESWIQFRWKPIFNSNCWTHIHIHFVFHGSGSWFSQI